MKGSWTGRREAGGESGGSGGRTRDLLPTKRMWERTTYVIAKGGGPCAKAPDKRGQTGGNEQSTREREAGAGRGTDGGNGPGEGADGSGSGAGAAADERVPGGRAAAEGGRGMGVGRRRRAGIELEVEKELGGQRKERSRNRRRRRSRTKGGGQERGSRQQLGLPGGVYAGQRGEHSNIHTSAIKAVVTSGEAARYTASDMGSDARRRSETW